MLKDTFGSQEIPSQMLYTDKIKVLAICDEKFFITHKEYVDKVKKILKCFTSTKNGALILRNKSDKGADYEAIIYSILETFRYEDIRHCLYLHSYTDLAVKYKLCCHITSNQLFDHVVTHELQNLGCGFGVSTHNKDEINLAKQVGASYALFGNVFTTSSKPGKEAEGIETLKLAVQHAGAELPMYAIGGIEAANLHLLRGTGIAGVCLRTMFSKDYNPVELTTSITQILGF